MSFMLRWIHYVENNKTTDDEGFGNDKNGTAYILLGTNLDKLLIR